VLRCLRLICGSVFEKFCVGRKLGVFYYNYLGNKSKLKESEH